jgi:PAS domain S-box-containing protein
MAANHHTPEASQSELEALQRRIAELEQQLAEREDNQSILREQVLIYEQALDVVPDMVLIKAAQSRIAFANRAFRDFYGMTMEQLRDLIDAPFVEPDYTQQYIKDDTLVFTTGQTLDIPSEPVTRYDGTVRLFHTVKTAITDVAGEVIRTVGISRDITTEQETQQALRESETYYRRLFDELPIGLALSRLDGSLVEINAAYAQILGRDVAETLSLAQGRSRPRNMPSKSRHRYTASR